MLSIVLYKCSGFRLIQPDITLEKEKREGTKKTTLM